MAPCVIGFILAPTLEENLAYALSWNKGDLTPFFTRPISCAFLVFTVVMVLYLVRKNMKKCPGTEVEEDDEGDKVQ